jgi:hypothetical protein
MVGRLVHQQHIGFRARILGQGNTHFPAAAEVFNRFMERSGPIPRPVRFPRCAGSSHTRHVQETQFEAARNAPYRIAERLVGISHPVFEPLELQTIS